MKIAQRRALKLRELPCGGDGVPNLSAIHVLLTKLINMVYDIIEINIGVLESSEAIYKVSPDFSTLADR